MYLYFDWSIFLKLCNQNRVVVNYIWLKNNKFGIVVFTQKPQIGLLGLLPNKINHVISCTSCLIKTFNILHLACGYLIN